MQVSWILVLDSGARYVNQPEPALTGHSVTVKADNQKLREMREQANKTFTPELAKLMQVGYCLWLCSTFFQSFITMTVIWHFLAS